MPKRTHIPKLWVAALGFILAALPARAATPTLNLHTRHNTPCEEQTKAAMQRLAGQFDLSKYTITRDIMVEQGATAHSYPELTMNCRFLRDDDLLLSQYVHEQGHWVLMERHRGQMGSLFDDLQRMFPNMPVEPPQGDGNLRSSYIHVAVIMLEWQGMEDLVGAERARREMEWKQKDHYTAIYAAVLEHRAEVEKLLQKYDIKF